MSAADELREFLEQHSQKPQEGVPPPAPASPAPTASRFKQALRKLLSGHRLDWREGSPGKGFFDSQGNLHTWVVDDHYEPNHKPYAEERGVDFRAPYLYINPDGRVEGYGLGDEEATKRYNSLSEIDPRLRPLREEDW